jgi:hypothetical protein
MIVLREAQRPIATRALPWASGSDFKWFDIFDSFNPFNVLSFDSFNCRSVFL